MNESEKLPFGSFSKGYRLASANYIKPIASCCIAPSGEAIYCFSARAKRQIKQGKDKLK